MEIRVKVNTAVSILSSRWSVEEGRSTERSGGLCLTFPKKTTLFYIICLHALCCLGRFELHCGRRRRLYARVGFFFSHSGFCGRVSARTYRRSLRNLPQTLVSNPIKRQERAASVTVNSDTEAHGSPGRAPPAKAAAVWRNPTPPNNAVSSGK